MAILPLALVDRQGHPYRVRALEAGDRPALQAMYEDFRPRRAAQGLPPADPDRIARWLKSVLADGLHLVIEIDGELRGHAMLLPMNAERAELANFLHQSARNRGIGTEVNRIVLALAHEAGFRRVWLSVEPGNRPAVRSYERAGFRILPGQLWAPEIEMEAVLEPPGPDGQAMSSPPAP
jgi:RimJ/RimL family protein N-acetyltransferase